MDRQGDGWTTPRPLCAAVNALPLHWEFSFSASGSLYVGADGDVFRATLTDGGCTAPARLPPEVNTAAYETTPFIAPDESYLIFARVVQTCADLYISFREPGGGWTAAVPMTDLNIPDNHELWPFVTYDGRYLFFIRNTGPSGDLKPYWVGSGVVDRYC